MRRPTCALDPDSGLGFRASPFEPMVHQRNLPSSGIISPLDSSEYRAWKSREGVDTVATEASPVDSQQNDEDQKRNLVGLVVETDKWPDFDDGLSLEENDGWKERFLKSEVLRTQTRIHMIHLLEENRKLRVKTVALEAELFEERKTNGRPSEPNDPAKSEQQKTSDPVHSTEKQLSPVTKRHVSVYKEGDSMASEDNSAPLQISSGSKIKDSSPERPSTYTSVDEVVLQTATQWVPLLEKDPVTTATEKEGTPLKTSPESTACIKRKQEEVSDLNEPATDVESTSRIFSDSKNEPAPPTLSQASTLMDKVSAQTVKQELGLLDVNDTASISEKAGIPSENSSKSIAINEQEQEETHDVKTFADFETRLDKLSTHSHINSTRGASFVSSPSEESAGGSLDKENNENTIDTNDVEGNSPAPPVKMTRSRLRQRNEVQCTIVHDVLKTETATNSPMPRRMTRRRAKEMLESMESNERSSAVMVSRTPNSSTELSHSDAQDKSIQSIEDFTKSLSPIENEQTEDEVEWNIESDECRNDVCSGKEKSKAWNSTGTEMNPMSESVSKSEERHGKRKRNRGNLLDSFQAPTLRNKRRHRR